MNHLIRVKQYIEENLVIIIKNRIPPPICQAQCFQPVKPASHLRNLLLLAFSSNPDFLLILLAQ